MKELMAWLDRHMGALVLVVTILLLGGVTVGATLDAPVKSALLKRVDASAGDYNVAVSLSKGSDKPIVYSAEGRSIADVSAWESHVVVNGTRYVLYYNSYNMVRDGNVIVLTWSHDAFAIQERIETTPTGVTIAWSWLRHPRSGPQEIELEVGQFAYYMQAPAYADGVVSYRLSSTDPRYDPPYLPVDPRDYDVKIRYDPPPAHVWFGETPDGVDGVHVRHRLQYPPAGQNVPFFTQHIAWERTDAPLPPPGPAEVRGIPVLDPGTDRVRLAAGDYLVGIALNKGSDKPLLRARDGRPLLDLSAWDSELVVNGTPRSLYAHEFNVSADGTWARITWFDAEYALEQNLTVGGDGVDVRWSWLRDANASAQRVELRLAHFAAYMENLTTNGTSVAYSLSPRDPLLGSGSDGAPYQMRVDFDRAPALLRFDGAPEGNRSFVAAFTLDDAPAGQRVPFLAQRVSYERADEPRPLGPAPRVVAEPVRDHAPERLLMRAGGYHAEIALTKGADQPLLRADDGRALLEISAWESFLRVNDRELPVYRLDHVLNLSGPAPCIEWTDPQFTLRECILVTSEGMRVDWAWRRAPDAPPQDVRLSVGHFAYLLENAGRNGETLEYFLQAKDPREGASADPRYHVIMRVEPAPLASPFGPDAFRLEYELREPEAGAWTPIFSETLRYEREASA